jgi:hypothetical protein
LRYPRLNALERQSSKARSGKEDVMKAIIGGVAGALALGGALLLANTRSASTAAPASYQTRAAVTAPAPQPLAPSALAPTEVGNGLVMAGSLAPNTLVMPVQYPVQYPVAAAQPQMVERVVYVERPATRTVTRARTVSRAPVRYRVVRKEPRSWKKSALIIGGGAAGGAGVGALLGGGSGAKKGAVVGGIGGLVYDLATRNKK